MANPGPLPYNYDIVGQRRLISNPLFMVLRSFIPERIKEVFLLCDFLVYNSEQVLAALKKFSEYPVTDLSITAKTDSLTNKYKSLLNDTLGMKSKNLIGGFDLMLYGNGFYSLYYPFTRYLSCVKCEHRTNINKAEYSFNSKSFTFNHKCENCGHKVAALMDKPNKVPESLSVIRWDPKDIAINYEPMSDTSEYYLRVSEITIDKILKGDKHVISKIPLAIFNTIQKQQLGKDGQPVLFKFKSDELYHMKTPAPAGINYGWGIPPIMAALNAVFYVNTLRKANEAIALERMLSFRVLHPGQRTSSAEPAARIRLDTWVDNMKQNYERFRVDQNHVMFSPVPVESSSIGGDGKLLMTIGELEAAETNILLALGIPREFVYGGLNNLGGSITLRNLENQLFNHSEMLERFSQWVADRCAAFLGWAKVEVTMPPFKLIDDVQQKAADMQMYAQGLLSKHTLLQMHSHDYDDERRFLQEEAVDDHKFQQEVAEKVEEISNALQTQVKQQAGGGGMGSDAILQQAYQYFEELSQMPYEQRKSALYQLQQQDYVTYSVVSKLMSEQTDGDGVQPAPDQAQVQGVM